MQYVFRYSLKQGSAAEHQRWLNENEGDAQLRRGWNYLGTWFNLQGFDSYDYETRWELNERCPANARPFDKEVQKRMSAQLPFVESGETILLGTVQPIQLSAN
jgi:hypothetical protein